MTVDEVYALALQSYQAGDFGDAAEALERVTEQSGFAQAAEAQFLLATAYFEDEQFITSQAEYTRFLDRYPAHPSAPDAALGICRSNAVLSPIPQRDQTFTEQALLVCRNVAADFAGHPVAEQAGEIATRMRERLAEKVYDNGAYYLRKNFHDSAVIYFQSVVSLYPDTQWAPRALLGIIEAYTEIGYDDEIETARQRLLAQYPDSPEAKAIGGG